MSIGNYIQIDIECYLPAVAFKYCSTKSSLVKSSGIITTNDKGKINTYDTVCFANFSQFLLEWLL